ncbi:class I SAM-dependent methyltransferase [Desulfonatronum thiosulfatophilum]|uniref:class I SAM-dependent methyltransferase n=1 Tax=Desulfonatronum thiosulfatophilum TaxID=617002 RepID=UPI0011137D39|nr:class I SAM-dependent methyltransferase [Desulfonatronum thiosulfatophilum]
MTEATSLHSLNADHGPTNFQRITCFLVKWMNNRFSRKQCDLDLDLRHFVLPRWQLEGLWPTISMKAPPARRLSDMFWMSLPWTRVADALGGDVHILEFGCGSGRYGRMLQNLLGDSFQRYVGVDVKRHRDWDQ